ncbi:Iron-sulfur flavoprotein [uncultured archaeon]|nr:Iron-sulfur flavoprotein [uncultured archaeon]
MAKMPSDAELKRVLQIDDAALSMFRKVREGALAEAKRLDAKKTGKIKVLGFSGSARDEFDMAQEGSNSEELLKRCLGECEKLGAQAELVQLRNMHIEHCKACYSTTNMQCHFYCSCYPKGSPTGDDMSNVLYDKILAADAVIFATPVNNFKMSTPMAAFLDRCISLDGSLSPANPKKPKDRELNIKHTKFVELTADIDTPGTGTLHRFAGKVGGMIVTGHEEGASMVISSLFMALSHFWILFPPFSNMYAMASVCNSTYADKKMVLGECYDTEVKLLARNVMKGAELARKAKFSDWPYDNSKD